MRTLLLSLVFSLFLVSPISAQFWPGDAGEPLPFENDAAVLSFLSQAEVVDRKEIPQGINRPLKVRLRHGDIEANAVFRTVDVRKLRHQNRNKTFVNFHDSFVYECAAYRLSRLLSLDNVPPCVERKLDGQEGSLQLWVEQAMTEKDRRDKELEAPSPMQWARYNQTMRLFDALIYNFDRNQGNILIGHDWKLWFIDHTRSFRVEEEIRTPSRIIWCDRGVWEALHRLDREMLQKHLGEFLNKKQIKALLARRDLLIEHIQGKIDKIGESAVLFSWNQTEEVDPEELGLAGDGDDIPKTSTIDG